MDPQVAWDELRHAYASRDWSAVERAAVNLLTWLDRKGFPPAVSTDVAMDAEWNRALALAACRFAIRSAAAKQPSPNELPC